MTQQMYRLRYGVWFHICEHTNRPRVCKLAAVINKLQHQNEEESHFGGSHGRQEPTAETGLRNPKVISLAVLSLAFASIFFDLKKPRTFHGPISAWEFVKMARGKNGKRDHWESSLSC